MISAEAWPEADQLFRSDPKWLGSDDAYSIPLDDDRTLWLFGDTFTGDRRGEAGFLRNSIGIQTGRDPSSASIRFRGSTFEAEQSWLWPLHGSVIGGKLLLFFMKVRPSRVPSRGPIEDWRDLGNWGFFDVFDWETTLVHNPLDDPETWRCTKAPVPDTAGIVLGAAVIWSSDCLYAYGWKDRQAYLARWGEPLQWFSGGGWTADPNKAAAILSDVETEFTVHFEPSLGRWCQIQLQKEILIRTAERPEGPWSDPQSIFVPEESFAYAGKAHPQLTGADLVLTYASIGPNADATLGDDSVYYPRFVRVTF